MNPHLWAEIALAHEDLVRLVTMAFADRKKSQDLGALRTRLRRRLDELLAALSPPLTPEEAVSVLVPLVFWVDELVQIAIARTLTGSVPEWPQLQRDLYPEGDGGDAFYEQAAALLRRPDPPPLLVGIYAYCLGIGFQGRLVDDPAAIPKWKARLAARLPLSTPAAAVPEATSFRRPRPRAFYVLSALGAVLAFQIVLLAITRTL